MRENGLLHRSMWWWSRLLARRPSRRALADGVAYSWAEFESYYFDADMAAEIWEVAEVVAAPEPTPEPSPLFFRPGLPSFESLHDFQCASHS